MSTLAVTVACVTCIVKTGKPPSVFLRQMFVPPTKLERHPPKHRLIGMPLCMGMPHPGGRGETQPKPPKPLFITETVSLRMVISAAGKALKRGFMLHMQGNHWSLGNGASYANKAPPAVTISYLESVASPTIRRGRVHCGGNKPLGDSISFNHVGTVSLKHFSQPVGFSFPFCKTSTWRQEL